MSENEAKSKEKVLRKSMAFAQVFSTPAGKEVLEALTEEFDGDELRQNNPHDTYYRLGQRDVVKYIEQMLRISKRNEDG